MEYFHEENENTLIVKFINKFKRKNKELKFIPRYGDIAKGHDNFFFYIKKYENIHYFKKVKKESAKKYNIEEWCDKFEEGITKIKEYQSKLEFHSDLHTSTEPQNLHWIWNQEIEDEFLKECERYQYIKIFDEEMRKNINQDLQ